MADQIIRPANLPLRTSPVPSEIIPVDNGSVVGGATIESIVASGRPTASQMEAEAGTNASKAMTPLTTKQSIASEIGDTIASAADGVLAQNAVPMDRIIGTNSGLVGGGNLSEDRSFSLSPSVIASLALADTAVQPSALGSLAAKSFVNNSDWSGTPLAPVNGGLAPGGATGQALIKSSSTDYDASWQTVAAATAVSYAPQSLNEAQKLIARTNINAASRMDSQRNLIVNGSMVDSQENGNTLGTTNGYFAADQFGLYFSAASAAMSIQRVQSSRSLAGAANKLEFKTTTAKGALAATDFVMISQPIEGSRPDFVAAGWGAAGAKPFIYRHEMSLPAGLYHLHVQNSAGNRHIAIPFTVAGGDANAAKVHEIVVPGDTTGTWLTADGTIGATFDVVLAAGTSRTGGSASTWGASTFYAASTQKNILDSTANVARLADVGLRLDPDATGVYGAYQVGEVDADYRSERYWCQLPLTAGVLIGCGQAFAATNGAIFVSFPFRLCQTPNFGSSLANTFTVWNAAGTDISLTSIALGSASNISARVSIGVASGLSAGNSIILRAASASSIIQFRARLS